MSLTTISGPSNFNILFSSLMFGEILERSPDYILGHEQLPSCNYLRRQRLALVAAAEKKAGS
jgi:hypothetical protein